MSPVHPMCVNPFLCGFSHLRAPSRKATDRGDSNLIEGFPVFFYEYLCFVVVEIA